jgi:outer membrane protein TolC
MRRRWGGLAGAVALVGLVAAPARAADSTAVESGQLALTLSDCVRLARSGNLGFLSAYQTLLSSHAQLERARAPFGPQADLTLNVPTYSEFRDVEENVALATRVVEDRTNFVYRGQLSLSQRLRHLGELSVVSSGQRQEFWSNRRDDYEDVVGDLTASYSQELLHTPSEELSLNQAELGFTSARQQYEAEALALEGDVTSAFFDLVEAVRQLEIEQQRLEQSRANLELAQRKFEIGLIAEVEALRLRVTMLNSEANFAQAQTLIERRRDALRQVLGMDMGEPLEVVTQVEFQAYDIDPARALEVGLQRRTDLRQAEITEQLRNLSLQDTRRRNGVNATLSASVSLLGRGKQLQDISDNLGRSGWDVGVQVTMPVLDSGERRGAVRQAEIQIKQAELARDITRQSVVRQVRDAVRNLAEAERQIALRQASLAVSERAYEVEKSRFELGLAQSQELLNAQADLTSNRIDALDAVITYQRQLLALRLATMAKLQELAAQ